MRKILTKPLHAIRFHAIPLKFYPFQSVMRTHQQFFSFFSSKNSPESAIKDKIEKSLAEEGTK